MTLYGIIVKTNGTNILTVAFNTKKKAKDYLQRKAFENKNSIVNWNENKDKVFIDSQEMFIIKYKAFI